MLRQEQDLEYQAALRADQEKERLTEEHATQDQEQQQNEEKRASKLAEMKAALPEGTEPSLSRNSLHCHAQSPWKEALHV